MGQYYKVSNPDTFEYMSPGDFGDGIKLMQFASGTATLSAIAVLITVPASDERGDWAASPAKLGAWAGKRLVVGGDYADEGRFVPSDDQDKNLYAYLVDHGTRIGDEVKAVLANMDTPAGGEAARSDTPSYAADYFFDAPDGMQAYLYHENASRLEFSFKQLHAFGYHEVGLLGEEPEKNLSEALRYICLKFKTKRSAHPKVEQLEKTLSADSMRVEKVRFNLDGLPVTWSFPLKVETVYKALQIL